QARQTATRLGARGVVEFVAVPAGELVAFVRIMRIPFPQFGGGRDGLEPLVPRRLVLALSAGPDSIDQDRPSAARPPVVHASDIHRIRLACHTAIIAYPPVLRIATMRPASVASGRPAAHFDGGRRRCDAQGESRESATFLGAVLA